MRNTACFLKLKKTTKRKTDWDVQTLTNVTRLILWKEIIKPNNVCSFVGLGSSFKHAGGQKTGIWTAWDELAEIVSLENSF